MTRGRFGVALLLTAGSGGAALGHELLWTRRLIDLLGAGAESSTRVFGVFFLGLALGAALATRWAAWAVRPWRAVARAEAGVALLGLPALLLPSWTGGVWPALGPERLTSWAGGAVKLALSLVVLLPPALMMGTVLPLMLAAVLRAVPGASRRAVWLYAVNTLGGVLGLALCAGVALPALGLDATMLLALVVNLLVAGGALALDRSWAPSPAVEAAELDAVAPPDGRRVFRRSLAVAFVSGAGILAAEVVALEMVFLAAPPTFLAPTAVLGGVILLLGVAAALVPFVARPPDGGARLLPDVLALTAVALAAAPVLFAVLLARTGGFGPGGGLAGFLLRLTGLVVVTLGPALLAGGLVFPLALSWYGAGGGDPRGRRWGWLLAVNGLGGLIGAELAYRVLLPACGPFPALGVVALSYALTAVGLLLASRPELGTVGPRALRLGVVAAVVLAATVQLLPDLPVYNPIPGLRVVAQRFGREGVLAVVEGPSFGRGLLLSNQYFLGTTSARYYQERQAHLPLLLHPEPRSVAFIGLATGGSAGAALLHGAVGHVTAVELSSLVTRAADDSFRDVNHGVTRSERATVVVEDGRTYLASCPGRFDVVVGDLFQPWGPGEGRLYSLEHFRAVRRALRPGGVFCQWLAAYQLTPAQLEVIAATFHEAFPRTVLFRNSFDLHSPYLALVGFRDGDLDWATVQGRCRALRAEGMVRDPVVRHVEGPALLYLGRYEGPGRPGVPLNTLGNMRVELGAGLVYLTGRGRAEYLRGDRWLEFVRRRVGGAAPAGLDPAWQGLPRLGLLLTEWEAAVQAGRPADALRARIAAEFPAALRADEGASWAQWPGDPGAFRPPSPGEKQGADARRERASGGRQPPVSAAGPYLPG